MKSIRMIALTAVSLVMATPSFAESLSEAVQTTVSTHPQVGEVSNDRRAIDQELEQAKGLFRPQIDFRGDAGLGVSNRWGNGGAAVDDGDILPNAAAQISLQQMLFDGYNAQAEKEKQRNRIRSAAGRVRETSELIGLNTAEVYLNTLRARQMLEIADTNLSEHRNILRGIERRTRGGAGNKADVEQAKARLAQAEAARTQIEADLRSAEARYNSLVGKFPGDLTRPNIPQELMPMTESAAVTAALESSPTIGIRAADVDTAGSDLKQQKASFYPTLNIEGSASRQKDLGGVRTTKDEAGVGLVMRWNLYRGGADTAREKEFQWRQAEAQSRLDSTRRQVEEDMRTAWAARDSARLRAERYAEQVASNEQVLKAYKKQFDAGERTLLDTLDAQNELFISKSSMLTSYYTALFGDYTVLANRGALLASLNVTLPETATVASEQSNK